MSKTSSVSESSLESAANIPTLGEEAPAALLVSLDGRTGMHVEVGLSILYSCYSNRKSDSALMVIVKVAPNHFLKNVSRKKGCKSVSMTKVWHERASSRYF